MYYHELSEMGENNILRASADMCIVSPHCLPFGVTDMPNCAWLRECAESLERVNHRPIHRDADKFINMQISAPEILGSSNLEDFGFTFIKDGKVHNGNVKHSIYIPHSWLEGITEGQIIHICFEAGMDNWDEDFILSLDLRAKQIGSKYSEALFEDYLQHLMARIADPSI